MGTGARPVSSDGDPYTFPALSDAEEDEAPSLTMGQQRWGEAVKHSTPQEGSPRLRRRPPGGVPSRQGKGPEPRSLRPARTPRSTPSLRAGPGRSAPLQTPQLSDRPGLQGGSRAARAPLRAPRSQGGPARTGLGHAAAARGVLRTRELAWPHGAARDPKRGQEEAEGPGEDGSREGARAPVGGPPALGHRGGHSA
ncbi:collagen alpha-1(I) chain-like [Vulpes lagopus]|uniref:collagen alpha-1(I) chain-like n=1 Tax=Vulpes lagopus TaxID=494514 RepID=UPI001BCA0075|nr:collagen alpha-1(I) chain-like [Vulpes lagopus]